MVDISKYVSQETAESFVDDLNQEFADSLRAALNESVLDTFESTEDFGVEEVEADGPYFFNEDTWEIGIWPHGYEVTIYYGDDVSDVTLRVEDGVSDDPVDQYISWCKKQLSY